MTPSLLGAGVGLLGASGVLIAVGSSPPLRRPRLAQRLAPYLRDAPTHFRKSAIIDGASGRFPAEVSPVGYPREYKRADLDLPARVLQRVNAFDL